MAIGPRNPVFFTVRSETHSQETTGRPQSEFLIRGPLWHPSSTPHHRVPINLRQVRSSARDLSPVTTVTPPPFFIWKPEAALSQSWGTATNWPRSIFSSSFPSVPAVRDSSCLLPAPDRQVFSLFKSSFLIIWSFWRIICILDIKKRVFAKVWNHTDSNVWR